MAQIVDKWPVLFHKARTGAIHSWRVWVNGDEIVTNWGQVGGQFQETTKKATPKNLGRSNATTAHEQAVLEAEAMHKFKLDRKYSLTPEVAQEDVLLPMLAHPYEKYAKKISFPVDVQPKLDGCFTYNTSVVTDRGHLPIGRIVEEHIDCKVLSWNEGESRFEYKPVTNYFYNGKAPQSEWCEIRLENSRRIKATWNHKFLTNSGWLAANELDPKTHKIACNSSDSRIMGLLMGTLLGDSCLTFDKRSRGASPRLIFSHSEPSLLEHKIKAMGVVGSVNEYDSGYGTPMFRFCSSNNIDADLNVFYYLDPNSPKWGQRRTVTQSMLRNYLSREGLSLWIADDGCIRSNNGNKETPVLQIATHSQSKAEVEEMVSYFTSVWGVTPTPIKDQRVEGDCGWFLNFKTKDTVYLLSRLRGVAWHGVEYKFFFTPEAYVPAAQNTIIFQSFTIGKARKSPPINKYDIEVADNHNYIANGAVVHNCRALARWESDRVVLISRGGKEWKVTTHINEELEKFLPRDAVLDGEIYLHGKSFQWISARTKKRQEGTEQLEYHCYDMPEVNGDDSLPWSERCDKLSILLYERSEIEHIYLTDTFRANDADYLKWQHDRYVRAGYEGAIIRTLDGKYEYGHRSPSLLKMKNFDDGEYKIIGHTSGVGKESDLVIWRCEAPNGLQFETRPRGTHEERRELLKEAESHYGEMLKVRFFGFTDEKLPRFPVGLGIRPVEDM